MPNKKTIKKGGNLENVDILDIEVKDYLLSIGIVDGDINKQNEFGHTPLYLAIADGKRIIVTKLIYIYNADVNISSNTGITPLFVAVYKGWLPIVKVLIANYAEINHKNNFGHTALIIASVYNKENIVKYLIDNDADINIEDNGGLTALNVACIKGHFNIVKILINEMGKKNMSIYEINKPNKKGETPFQYAKQNGNIEIINLFITLFIGSSNKNVDIPDLESSSEQKEIPDLGSSNEADL